MTIAVVGLVVIAGDARAACGAFPSVSWWGNVTHESVQAYVAKYHNGNWLPYVLKWENQLKKITDIHSRDSATVVPNQKMRLDGDSLRLYISQVAQRVEIVKCLAGQAVGRNTKSAMNMR